MALAKGVNKVVTIAEESVWGEKPAANVSTAFELRRVTADFNLVKENYQSNEINKTKQVSDVRHGTRSSEGTLDGELSPSSYANLFAAALDSDFADVPDVVLSSGLEITAGTVPGTYKLIASAEIPSVVVGSVITLTGTDTDNVNLLVLAKEADTTVVFKPLTNSATVVVEEVTSEVTIEFSGKRVTAPLTGHTQKSFTVEEWFSDISISEVHTGLKVGSVGIEIPASGIVTCNFGMQGKDSTQSNAQYFTASQAANTKGTLSSSTGAMIVDGKPVGIATSISLNIDRSPENAVVIGSNSIADISTGRIAVTGSAEVYFGDAEFKDYFDKERKIAIVVALTAGNHAKDDAVVITLPSVKVNSFTKNDGEQFIIASCDFQALLTNPAEAGFLPTTMQVVDTSL